MTLDVIISKGGIAVTTAEEQRPGTSIAQEQRPGTSIPALAVAYGISEASLYSAAKLGRLPGCRRINRRFVVDRETFAEWLRSGNGDELADADEK